MKSITISPDKSRILICFAISSAASKFVFNAVFSIFDALIDWPELMSIATKASVGFITKYPPDFNFTTGSKILFNSFSIPASWNKGILPECFIFYLIPSFKCVLKVFFNFIFSFICASCSNYNTHTFWNFNFI